MQWRKDIFTKQCGENWMWMSRRMKLDPYLLALSKNQLHKPETPKPLEEKVETEPQEKDIDKYFLNETGHPGNKANS